MANLGIFTKPTNGLDRTVEFGAKSLAGIDSGILAPTGATSITGGTATGYTMSGGHVYPTTNGSADDGTLIFDNGVTWTMDTTSGDLANTYHVRDEKGYDAWVAAADNDTVCQYHNGARTGFCKNNIHIRIKGRRQYGDGYGKFIEMEDYWITAPVTVDRYDPAWSSGDHGAMLDADVDNFAYVGWTNREGYYALANRAQVPVTMDASEIHVLTVATTGAFDGGAGGANQVVGDYHALTSIPPSQVGSMTATMFRPCCVGTRRLLDWADVDTGRLPGLTLPTGTVPSLTQLGSPMVNKSPDNGLTSAGAQSQAAKWHPELPDGSSSPYDAYPREMSMKLSRFAVMMCSDHADAHKYAQRVVQMGIDIFGGWDQSECTVQAAVVPAGGFGNGWEFPLLLAATLLQDATYQAADLVAGTGNGANNGKPLGDGGYCYEGDDFRNTGATRVLWGERDPDGTAHWDTVNTPRIGEPEPKSGYSGSGAGNAYRHQVSTTWPGQYLAMKLITGMEALIFRDEWLRYIERYYTEKHYSSFSGSAWAGSTLVQNAWTDWIATAYPTTPAPTTPTGSALTATTATGGFTSDIGNGTLYVFVSTSATPPSATDLKAGTGAVYAASQDVGSVGVQTLFTDISGLTTATTYYNHFLHTSVAGVDSSILTSASYTTP